jgi:o-succinylbenzoate synthase
LAERLHAAVASHRLVLRQPLRTGHGDIAERQVLLLSVTDGEHVGWGESAPLGGFTVEHFDESLEALDRAIRALSRINVPLTRDDITEIVESFDLHKTPCARAAVESALCDLAAKSLNKTLARFLCSAASESVPVNALVDDAPSAVAAVAAGFATLKAKLTDRHGDLERVEEIRQAAPTVAFRLDANGCLNEAVATPMLSRIAALRLEYIEELSTPGPVWPGFPPRGERPFAIAADESAAALSPDELVSVAEVVVLKPSAMGGPLKTLRFARALERQGVACAITSFVESAVGVRAALATAAALHGRSRFRLAAGLATSALFVDDLAQPPRIERGHALVDPAHGLGATPVARSA